MPYGQLPLTGIGALTLGGVAVHTPVIAAVGLVLILFGAILLRLTRPVRLARASTAGGVARVVETHRRRLRRGR